MKFKIYSKAGCSSCQQAKTILDTKKLSYEYLMLGKDYQMSDFIEASQGNTHKTFPLILKDGEYLGGLPDLKKDLL